MYSKWSNKLLITIIICLCIVSMHGLTVQSTQVQRTNVPSRTSSTPATSGGSADLSVQSISGACLCDLSDADALYIQNITVRVKNGSGRAPYAASAAVLKITYYDVAEQKEKVLTKNLPSIDLNNYNTTSMLEAPLLVKKSKGVKVEVQTSTQGVSDPNPDNNIMTMTECGNPSQQPFRTGGKI